MPRQTLVSERVAVVLGTRPEIIKLAGVIRLLGPRAVVVHTGQHYDEGLSSAFFDEYRLPRPALELQGVGGRQRGDQFAAIIGQLTAAFTANRPRSVVVQGDTNTAAAAAQAAHFLELPVVHVEAGLRSHDRGMPEEINRKLIGVIADLQCAPTQQSESNLLVEGVLPERIAVTGNTVVEATLEMLPDAEERQRILEQFGVRAGAYVLATIHRPENTDDPVRLGTILAALAGVDLPTLLPMHPRTRAKIEAFGWSDLLDGLRDVAPVEHHTFLALAAEARLLVSDSGGIQEECTVLKQPLLVVRNSTERPEAVEAGYARRVLPNAQLASLVADAAANDAWRVSLAGRRSPYGDGTASSQIVKAMERRGLA